MIHVGPLLTQVALIGSVNRPAVFELKPGETVTDLLRMAGGFSAVADRSRLAVERLDWRLVEAAHDLHAGPVRAFATIVIPRTAGGIAAGCQLVAMCDLAVAARDARFAVSGVNLGLFCSTPGVALSRNLSRKAAFEMLATGDFISADEAHDKGLVNRVADASALDAEVEQLVARILSKPRAALAMGKALFYRQLEKGIQAAYDDAQQTMACNMMDASALEGVQAFIDKRTPSW